MEHDIISLSVEKGMHARIERVRQEQGFQRSEFWRKAAAAFITEIEEVELKGRVQGALTVVHQERDDVITRLKHQYTDVVQTHLHTHLEKEHTCLEVLILDGAGRKVQELLSQLRKEKGVLNVKFAAA